MRVFFAALVAALLAVPAAGAPISYQARLQPGETLFGRLPAPPAQPYRAPFFERGHFYSFQGTRRARVTLTVNRLERAFDPVLYVFDGRFDDTRALDNDAVLAVADDTIAELPGFAGVFSDPQARLRLPRTGVYTVFVTFALFRDPGPDGAFDYQITLGRPPAGQVAFAGDEIVAMPLPLPGVLLLGGLAMVVGLRGARRG
ncbi:MAG: hypothetical protein AAF677_03180 [Pseudomonadota bacterium]